MAGVLIDALERTRSLYFRATIRPEPAKKGRMWVESARASCANLSDEREVYPHAPGLLDDLAIQDVLFLFSSVEILLPFAMERSRSHVRYPSVNEIRTTCTGTRRRTDLRGLVDTV